MDDYLIKRKKEIRFPYLPFINKMLLKVKGTNFEKKWEVMNECIISERKRMSLDQIHKMDQTLRDLQNDLKRKEKSKEMLTQSPWENQSQASTSMRRDSFRNPSPPTAQPSLHYHHENNVRNFIQNRYNDRKVNDSYQYNRRQNSPTPSRSFYDSRKRRSPSPQRRFYDNHGSRGRFDYLRNFNYNKYNTSSERFYDRSQSRPAENFKGRDRNDWRYERSKSKPFERSKSRPFEVTKKDIQQPSKNVNNIINDNFLSTHPKFANNSKSSTVISSERKSFPEKVETTKDNVIKKITKIDESTGTLKAYEMKENKTEDNLVNVTTTTTTQITKLQENEERQNCDVISSTEYKEEDVIKKKSVEISSNVTNIETLKEVSEKSEVMFQKVAETKQQIIKTSTVADDKENLQSNEVTTTDNKDMSSNVKDSNEKIFDDQNEESLHHNSVDDKTFKNVKNIEEVQYQTTTETVLTIKSQNENELEYPTCIQNSYNTLENSNDFSVQATEQQTVESNLHIQIDHKQIFNDEVQKDEIKIDHIEEVPKDDGEIKKLCNEKNQIERPKEFEKSLEDTKDIIKNNDQIYRSDSDASDVEEEPEIIVELWEKMSKTNTMNSTSLDQIKQIEKAIKIEPSDESSQNIINKISEPEENSELKKIRKKKNELEKLQEDLNRTIDSDSYIMSSIKPRSCTLPKPNDNKYQLKPFSIKLTKLILTTDDMPIKVSDFESKYSSETKKILPKIAIEKKKVNMPKSTTMTSTSFLSKNIKAEPMMSSSNTVIFEKTIEPKSGNIVREKRKSCTENLKSSISKKPKLCELKEEEEEWIDCPTSKVVTYKSSMKLKKFKKCFDKYIAECDNKNPEILKIEKIPLKQFRKKKCNSEVIDNKKEEESVVTEDNSKETIVDKKQIIVDCPTLVSLQHKIHNTPIVVRRTLNEKTSEIKCVAMKPKDIINNTPTKEEIGQTDVTKSPETSTSTQQKSLKSLLTKTSPQTPTVNTAEKINKVQKSTHFATTSIISIPASGNLIKINSASTEQSGRVEKIPITLPSLQTEQQEIEVIDISDEDDDENVINIDYLRPWIEQSKFKSNKNSKACKIMRNKFCLSALYKCMGSTCCFYTSEKNYFQIHLELHSNHQKQDASNYLLCSYCEHRAKDIGNLIGHINANHGSSIFSCNYCFYRSQNEFQVTMNHYSKYHANEDKSLIVFNPPYKREKNYDIKHVRQTISQYCQPFTCMSCTKNFYVISAFVDHIKMCPEKISKCIKCGETAGASNIIMHYFNCYGFGLFQCVYCLYGTSTLTLIDEHLSNKHPDRMTYFVSRNITESSNNRKNPSDISCLSLKEINKESTDDTRFEKIFVPDNESIKNSKNLGNLSDEQMESSEEEESQVPSTCSLLIENVLSLNTDNETLQ
ncbi:hypothetical protein PVAND_010528 [Polypedilum vanderplanki]|uniref:C2H2-type domain-containing protein n=1 Tax=Polypedilum vanderplanki TaxID=319348 RepID=A0A9J6CHJ4_POLVA|nr:hypothetical protein PVAND_010528 [Polypedilum vanderplanki]